MKTKRIRDVKPGDQTTSGIIYISEPAEQPDGSWSVMTRYPSGMRHILEFPSGDDDSEAIDE